MLNADPGDRRLRLLIVDDQPVIRRGLALILATAPDIDVVGQAADGREAIASARALVPDVVIMDLQMPHLDGVAATREITVQHPTMRVVVLTTYDDDERVFAAIRAGAHAYLLKDASEDEVLDTIRAVSRGEARLSPVIARKVMEQFRHLPDSEAGAPAAEPEAEPAPAHVPATRLAAAYEEPLTGKETRILDLIAQGMSNKQIAATVFLAEGTVKNYVSRIMDKLHARTRTELAVRAVKGRAT